MGKKLASTFNMSFIEVSAKSGYNIEALFEDLGSRVYEEIKDSQKSPIKRPDKRISLHNKEDMEEEPKNCKC